MIIDLCKPRKAAVNKLLNTKDEVLLQIKLHPEKYKRAAMLMVVVLVVLMNTDIVSAKDPSFYDAFIKDPTIRGSDLIDTKKELIDYYIKEHHYPREYAEQLINNMKNGSIKQCMDSANTWQQTFADFEHFKDKFRWIIGIFK